MEPYVLFPQPYCTNDGEDDVPLPSFAMTEVQPCAMLANLSVGTRRGLHFEVAVRRRP